MTRFAAGLLIALFFAGCAASTTTSTAMSSPATPGNVFTGEVWTWDEREGTITLRRGAEDIRVKVAPDQFIGLQLHQVARIRGELAPPLPITQIIVPSGPMTAVPRGAADHVEITGTVAAADPSGHITVTTPRGPARLWVPAGVDSRFPSGTNVRVRISVQPVSMVPAGSVPAPSSPEPAALPQSEPGDYSTVTGRVLRVDSSGVIAVDSPVGPTEVIVPDPTRYRPGDSVQARVSVHRAP